jgi:hypothetical protein
LEENSVLFVFPLAISATSLIIKGYEKSKVVANNIIIHDI